MFEASGKYRLDARLGGGGMAEVFVGSALGAEGFSRKIAIKRVLPGYSDNPSFAQMFVDEARISSRLVHPNIVSVLDFDRDLERRLFLVMELVEGKDLAALMGTGNLPFPVVAYVIAEALRGLGYAHDLPVTHDGSQIRGVVHRDVSPHNVLLSWEGAAKVSDFGIAKAREASEATASVFIKGKPAYMSPEQANGESLDGRSDLFAVGTMMWEMLTGRGLFTAEDTRATLAKVLFGDIPRVRTIRPDVPKDLDRFVAKLLERDLKARYATAEAAVTDLMKVECMPRNGREQLAACLMERFPHQAPIRHSVLKKRVSNPPVVPNDGLPVDATGATAISGTHTYGGDIPKPPARGRGLRIALIAGVAVVGGILGWLLVSGGKKKDPAVLDAGVVIAKIDAPAPNAVLDVGTPPTPDTAVPDASVPDAAVPDAAPPPDAAKAAPPDAAVKHPPPVDARPLALDAATPQKDAQPANTVETGFGTLDVTSNPIGSVFVDGNRIKESPLLGYRISVGPHTVAVDNDEDFKRSQTVTVVAGKPTKVDFHR